jgi:hypothetical protein
MRKQRTAFLAATGPAIALLATVNTADAGWGWWVPAPGEFVISVERGLNSFYLHGYTYGPYYGIPPYCYTRCPAYYGYYAPLVSPILPAAALLLLRLMSA